MAFGLVCMATLTGCPKKNADGLEEASSMQCVAERRNMQMAIESFTTLEGRPPATEAEMVPLYLRIESPYMDLGPNSTIIAAPGSGCA
jgi:hypothetical protein